VTPETPSPDKPYEQPTPVNGQVWLTVLGHTGHDTLEVLATDGDMWCRFSLPVKARPVRQFWRALKRRMKTDEVTPGVHQYPKEGGCGPYTLTGIAVGQDENGTVVVMEPVLTGEPSV